MDSQADRATLMWGSNRDFQLLFHAVTHSLGSRAARARSGCRGLIFLVELFARNHLVLENGRAQARQRVRVLAVNIPDLLLLAGKLARALDHGAADLLVRDLDAVALADLGQDEAEAHAPLGDLAVLRLGGLFACAFIGEAAPLFLKIVDDR